MSDPESLLRALIEAPLRNYASDNDLPVAWEDIPFDTPIGTYVRFNLLPAQTRSEDLAGKHRVFTGVAQITICVQSGRGRAGVSDIAAALAALYPCGGLLSSNPSVDGIALNVAILTPLAVPAGFSDKAHYLTPAYFNYRSDYVLS